MGRGFLHGNGGVNERKVWIKAYASEEALLADAPRSQTIGIVTSTAITRWCIQPTVPGSLEGCVWIKDNSSTWLSNFLQVINGTGNPPTYVPVFPLGCMQYISGAWKSRIAYFYKGSAWTQFSSEITYAYNNGTTSLSWNGTGTDTSSNLVMTTSRAQYGGSYQDAGWKGSTGTMAVPSGATKLCMKYSVSVSSGSFSSLVNTAFGLRTAAYSGYERYATNFAAYVSLTSGTDVTVSVPITSDMVGKSYYIGFQANTNASNENTEVVSTWKVSQIWFE